MGEINSHYLMTSLRFARESAPVAASWPDGTFCGAKSWA